MANTKKRRAVSAVDSDGSLFQSFTEIGIIDQLLQNTIKQLLAPGLNLAQFILLNHMSRRRGNASLVELAAAMQVTKGAMTNTVGRLAENGFVSVLPDNHDKRSKRVSLTGAGEEAHQHAICVLSEHLQPLRHLLASEDLQVTLQCLTRIRQWLDDKRNESRPEGFGQSDEG